MMIILCLLPWRAWAEDQPSPGLNEEVVQIPMDMQKGTGEKTVLLFATIFRPSGKGPFPLIVLSHGSSMSPKKRQQIGRYRLLAQIEAFVQRGFAVIVPIRRGYGETGGIFAEGYGACDAPVYYQAGLESAKDIMATIRYAAKLPYVRPDAIVLVGHSGGGFASLAVASLEPVGLKGVINFAGGRGGLPDTSPGKPCRPELLTEAISRYSQTIKTPVLWFYAANDTYFAPALVQDWFRASIAAGANGRLVIQPPFGDNGHVLFIAKSAIPIWTPEVDRFLREIGLSMKKDEYPKRPVPQGDAP